MTDKGPKNEITSSYMDRLLPEDSGPRLHHIYGDPDKAKRMIEKSLRKFRKESSFIQSKIDYSFLAKIRETYKPSKKERVRLPSLSPVQKFDMRSHSTVPKRQKDQLQTSGRSLHPTKPSESRLDRLNELIVDYSTATTLDKSSEISVRSRLNFANLKEKIDWAADEEIGQFRE